MAEQMFNTGNIQYYGETHLLEKKLKHVFTVPNLFLSLPIAYF